LRFDGSEQGIFSASAQHESFATTWQAIRSETCFNQARIFSMESMMLTGLMILLG
jgi:hypothetical protein